MQKGLGAHLVRQLTDVERLDFLEREVFIKMDRSRDHNADYPESDLPDPRGKIAFFSDAAQRAYADTVRDVIDLAAAYQRGDRCLKCEDGPAEYCRQHDIDDNSRRIWGHYKDCDCGRCGYALRINRGIGKAFNKAFMALCLEDIADKDLTSE